MQQQTRTMSTSELKEAWNKFHGRSDKDRPLNTNYLDIVSDYIDSNPAIKKVVELGCGCGDYIAPLAQRFPYKKFYGIDISPIGLTKTRARIKKMKLENLRVYNVNLKNFRSMPVKRFDLVLIKDVIRHVDEYKQLLINTRATTKRLIIYDLFKFKNVENVKYLWANSTRYTCVRDFDAFVNEVQEIFKVKTVTTHKNVKPTLSEKGWIYNLIMIEKGK